MSIEAPDKNRFAVHYDWYESIIEKLKNGKGPIRFEAKPAPWFSGASERCIEVPWAISRYAGQSNVLEVGLSLADMTLASAQIALKEATGCDLTAIDIVDIDRVRNRFANLNKDITSVFKFNQGDVRKSAFADNTFDLIFIISTIEHIGFDQFEPNAHADTVFKRPKDFPNAFPQYEACRDDRKVLAELKRILKPGGSVLLTVPMGNGGIVATKDSKGLYCLHKEYTVAEWKGLLKDSGMTVAEERFFRDGGDQGWIEDPKTENVDVKTAAMRSQAWAVACAELKK